MRGDKEIQEVTLQVRDNQVTSYRNKLKQKDNIDDRLSMVADDSSKITIEVEHIQSARENIFTYEKGS